MAVSLSRAGLARASPLASTALLVGANLPDVDLLWSRPELGYYVHHRGATHSVAGVAIGAVGLWCALLLFDRISPRSRAGIPIRRLPLLGICGIGVSSHLLLDAANGYGIRPWLPWDDRWVYGDLWVIVDPWVWLLLGGALFLTSRAHSLLAIVWFAAALAVTAVMLLAPDVPDASTIVWVLSAAALAALRRAGRRTLRPASRWVAAAALAAVAAYAALCAVSHGMAISRLRQLATAELPELARAPFAALPRPADPFRWDGFLDTPGAIYHRTVGATRWLDPPGAGFRGFPRGFEHAAARSVLDSCAGRAALVFFRFPFAAVEASGGYAAVVLRDARYVREGRRPFGMVEVPLAADGRPDLRGIRCP